MLKSFQVAINCPPRPAAISVAFLGLQCFEDVLSTYKIARQHLAEILSSCEFMDKSTVDCVEKNLKLKSPINKYPFYLLLETSGKIKFSGSSSQYLYAHTNTVQYK